MKFKAIIAAAALTALTACTGSPARYTVKGSVQDTLATLPGSMVYLLYGDEVKDSSAIKNGTFSFSGDIDKTKIYGVIMQYPGRGRNEARFVSSFVPDSKSIAIDLDYPATVTGSPLTDELGKLQENLMNLYYEKDVEINALRMNGKDAEADSVYNDQMNKIHDLCRQTFLDHSDDAIGDQAFSLMLQDFGYEELSALLEKAAPFIAEDPATVSQMEIKKAEFETGPGCPMREITGTTADGDPVKLSDFVGKGDYVLADFWASWCGPCMRALPEVRSLRDQYASKGLKLVGINVWERAENAGQECAKEKEMDWDIIFTSGREAPNSYGIIGIPSFVLFAPDGTIADRLLGDEGLAEMIARNLDK